MPHVHEHVVSRNKIHQMRHAGANIFVCLFVCAIVHNFVSLNISREHQCKKKIKHGQELQKNELTAHAANSHEKRCVVGGTKMSIDYHVRLSHKDSPTIISHEKKKPTLNHCHRNCKLHADVADCGYSWPLGMAVEAWLWEQEHQ